MVRMTKLSIAASVFALFLGCSSDDGTVNDGNRSGTSLTKAEINKCVEKGGVVTRGLSGEVCATATGEGDKSCTSNNQCEGSCLADVGELNNVGQCTSIEPFFGCYSTYENGVETAIVCVD